MSETKEIVGTKVGIVKSAAMKDSIVVNVRRKIKHPMYDKYIRRTSSLMVHDEGNTCGEGDKVLIKQGRPRSKNKSWELVKIIEKNTKVKQ